MSALTANTLSNTANMESPSMVSTDTLSWTLVRVATGLILIPHGAQKLFGWFEIGRAHV